jgi:hypothetical protein
MMVETNLIHNQLRHIDQYNLTNPSSQLVHVA